jgi:hypothetical protein
MPDDASGNIDFHELTGSPTTRIGNHRIALLMMEPAVSASWIARPPISSRCSGEPSKGVSRGEERAHANASGACGR